ncbi:MAG TPA: hypothetical protein VKA84_24380 [Gemmatimonadaceae bacterium]|nr:hypothetical protein [Gemmatimonadaceae bacterium]
MNKNEHSDNPERAGLFGEASGGELEAGEYSAADRGGESERERERGDRNANEVKDAKDAGKDREIPRGTDEHAD